MVTALDRLGRDTLGLLELINRRFRVPPQYPESAYRPLGSDLSLEQVLCFKHRRKMAKDIRWGSSCIPCSCCQARNDPAMPGRLWRSWKDWTASSGCAMRDASSPPRRRRPARYSSARATEVPRLLLPQPPEPTTWTSAGQRPSNHWIQGQRMRRIKWVSPSVRLPPRRLQLPPAQTNLPAEGGMEGNSKNQAQGNVAAGGREGAGDPQSNHQEIHGCRRSSGAAVPAGFHCVII